MNVCISRTSASNEILDVSLYKYSTVEELMKRIKLSHKSIFIKTPYYSQKLENNVQPFILYPNLIMQANKNQKYPIPYIEFPLMEVKFTTEELGKFNSIDFLGKCIKTFEFQCNDAFLLDSNQNPIEKNVSLKKLFEISKKSHLTFKCTVSDSCIDKISKRRHIIKEIINSEVIFVNNMQILHNYFHPTFLKTELFDQFQ